MIIGVALTFGYSSHTSSLDRFGDRFKARCFTDLERTRSDRKPDPAWSYAKRFAAKDALRQALGTGRGRFTGATWGC